MKRRTFIREIVLLSAAPLLWLPRKSKAQPGWSPVSLSLLNPRASGSVPSPVLKWLASAGVKNSSDVAPANNDSLNSWTDQIAGVVASWESARPKYNTGIQNGLGGITFPSTSRFSQSSLAMTLTTCTSFYIFKKDSSSGTYQFCFDSESASGRWIIARDNSSPSTKLLCSAGGTNLISSSTLSNSTAYIAGAVFNGASSSAWLNGTSVASGNPGSDALSSIQIGSQNNGTLQWSGYIMEIRFYSTPLGTSDIGSVFTELNSTYAVY